MDDSAVKEIASMAERSMQINNMDDGVPFAVVPKDSTVVSVENMLLNPVRKRGQLNVLDVGSFVAYIETHRTDAMLMVGDIDNRVVRATFDHHTDDVAGWRDHSVSLLCRLSDEWKAWMRSNRSMMSQAEFADFIEDNVAEVIEPDHATMIEISRTMEVKNKVDFSSSIRTRDGQVQFKYEEDVSGSIRAGTMEIPETFTLGICPFMGGKPYRVTARLRYRMSKGDLTLGYVINRPDDILRDAFAAIVGEIEEATGTRPLNGVL